MRNRNFMIEIEGDLTTRICMSNNKITASGSSHKLCYLHGIEASNDAFYIRR